MKSFHDLEQRYARVPARMNVGGDTASGFLALDRRKTEVVLTTDQFFHRSDAPNGWFDLRLELSDGPALLHNALSTESVYSGSPADGSVEHIYPNMVLIGRGAATAQAGVRRISAKLQNLSRIFDYKNIEYLPVYGTKREDALALKRLRARKKGLHDFYDPSSVFVMHRPQRVMRFSVEDRTYEIGMESHRRGLGWNHVELTTDVVATITFKMPTSIDDAIDAIWRWKRFFAQIGVCPFHPTAISVQASRKLGDSADVYLPAYEVDDGERRHLYSLQNGAVPLRRWKDRKRLAAVMQAWLAADSGKLFFRNAVDRVVDAMNRRTALDDVLTLCAGIEALPAFAEKPSVSKGDIALLAKGACDAIDANGLAVDKNRVRGILGLLANQSLPQRLAVFFDQLAPVLPAEDGQLLKRSILDLRQVAAHGQSFTDEMLPKIQPTVEALACLCILHDLMSAGLLPTREADGPCIALQRASWALAGLRQIGA